MSSGSWSRKKALFLFPPEEGSGLVVDARATGGLFAPAEKSCVVKATSPGAWHNVLRRIFRITLPPASMVTILSSSSSVCHERTSDPELMLIDSLLLLSPLLLPHAAAPFGSIAAISLLLHGSIADPADPAVVADDSTAVVVVAAIDSIDQSTDHRYC